MENNEEIIKLTSDEITLEDETKKCDNIQVEIEEYSPEDLREDGTLKPIAEFKYSVQNYMDAVVKQKAQLEKDIASQEYIIEVLEKAKEESGYKVEIERDLDSRRKILEDAKIAIQTMADRIELYNTGVLDRILSEYELVLELNTLLNNPLNLLEYQERLIEIKEGLKK